MTDDEGRFQIENIPPCSLRLTTRVPDAFNSYAWTSQKLKKFNAKPGEAVDVGDVEKTGR